VSRSQLRLVTPPPQAFADVTILTIPEFSERLKVPTRTGYRIASELPAGCVLHVRHGVRVVWERALEALAEEPGR
jgi:hypothetical protein